MKKVAIVVDDWKLPIFERHLKQSGYTYEAGPGVTPDTAMLMVSTLSIEALHAVAQEATNEAAKVGVRQ